MPNVMVALSNIGVTLCQRRKVWLTPTTRVLCSNAAKMWNPLKFSAVPQTRQQISAVRRPKFTILWGHVGEVSMFNKFFSDCRYMPLLRRYSLTNLCNGAKMAIFLHPVFSPSRMQHVSDMHSKFALRPHHVSKYGRHPMCGRWD